MTWRKAFTLSFAFLLTLAAASLMTATELPPARDVSGGGGASYASTLAGSILIGDGAGGFAEHTSVTFASGDGVLTGGDLDLGNASTSATIEALRTSAASGAVGLTLQGSVATAFGQQTTVLINSTVDYTSSDKVLEVKDPTGSLFSVGGDGQVISAGQFISNGTGQVQWPNSVGFLMTQETATFATHGGRFNIGYQGLFMEGDEVDGDEVLTDFSSAFAAFDTAADDGLGALTAYLPRTVIKATTGDPAFSWGNGELIVVNTLDNTVKIYADGGWRTIASGW